MVWLTEDHPLTPGVFLVDFSCGEAIKPLSAPGANRKHRFPFQPLVYHFEKAHHRIRRALLLSLFSRQLPGMRPLQYLLHVHVKLDCLWGWFRGEIDTVEVGNIPWRTEPFFVPVDPLDRITRCPKTEVDPETWTAA